MSTNAAIIRLTASLIEELINQGSIVVDGSLGNVKVRRMFLANESGAAGEVHIVIEDEGLPRVANYSCQLPYVNAEARLFSKAIHDTEITPIAEVGSFNLSKEYLGPDYEQRMRESAKRILSQNTFSVEIRST